MNHEASMAGKRLGIIAGAGRFPLMVVEGAKRSGCFVSVIALRGFAEPELAKHADTFYWSGIAKLGRWISILRRQQIHRVILAGSVRKSSMYGRFRLLRLLPDIAALRLWFFRISDKRNDTVLAAVADEFAKWGITMEECTAYTPEDMAPEGVLTRLQPTARQIKDADFGWKIAKQMGRLDIGQSIAVKETEVIAVEAMEGTDRMIQRAGQLCAQGGWSLIKVAKPNQDMRFDVPTVGADTIEKLSKHGAKMLVIEAGKTLIVDRKELASAADAAHVVVWARGEQTPV